MMMMMTTTTTKSTVQKLTVAQLIKNFPTIYGYQRRYRLRESLLLDPILSQMSSVHKITPCFFKIPFNII